MSKPGRWPAVLALACILVAIALPPSWEWWVQTRTWVPLEVPISLSAGHVKTPEFSINLPSTFEVQVLLDHRADPVKVDCFMGVQYRECKNGGALDASWVLYRSGRAVRHGDVSASRRVFWDGEGIGSFSGEMGRHYSLDVEIRKNSSDLDFAHPRLVIVEATDLGWKCQRAKESVFTWAVLLFALGVVLVILALIARSREIRNRNQISLTAPGPPTTVLHLESQPSTPRELQELGSSSPLSRLAWIGVALALLGLVGCVSVQYWMATRTFVALDMPVSLARGHIVTNSFRINLRDSYEISIETDQDRDLRFGDSCPSYLALRSRWALYVDGAVAARRSRNWWRDDASGEESIEGKSLGYFSADKKAYSLDVEVLSDGRCLDSSHPRLRVTTSKTDYESGAFLLRGCSLVFVGLGLALVGASLRERSDKTSSRSSRFTDANVGSIRGHLPLRRRRLRPPFAALPSFGLVAVLAFFSVVLFYFTLTPIAPRGLYVHVLRTGSPPPGMDQWTAPLIVHIKDIGPGKTPQLYVNSSAVAWNDLSKALQTELSRRSEWVVYVQGDSNIPWADAVDVVDVARGLRAKVIMLTPKTEFKQP